MMRHPFEVIPFETTSIILVLLLGITVSIWRRLSKIGQLLEIPEIAPQGILSLEFAFTAERTDRIIEAWRKANALDRAIKLQWLDFLFMAAYSTTFSLACVWSTKLLPDFDSRWLEAGIVLAWGQWVAAAFDAIENLCLFPFLYGTTKDKVPLTLIAAVSAGLKFGLIGLGVIYFLISIGFKISRLG